MKNLIKNSIITQAIELGFNFAQFTTDTDLQEVNEALVDFFNEKADKLPRLEDECEVISNGRTQHVSYAEYWQDGEIVDFSANWHKSPETRIFHSEFLIEDAGIMKDMHLYYLVGETAYNAPEGYFFDENKKRHIAFTYDIHFNDEYNSNNKGFEYTITEAEDYIKKYNGSKESYFADYQNGIVSIVNNQTGETVYEESIK